MNVRAHTSWFVGTGILALMLAYVWKGWHAHTLAARMDALRAEHQQLLDERDRLRARVIALAGIERIKRIAMQRLGLVDPNVPPVDVPAIAPLGPQDSLNAVRATGLEGEVQPLLVAPDR